MLQSLRGFCVRDPIMNLAPAAAIDPRQIWTRATLAPRDWLVSVAEACVDELDAALARLRATPRPIETLSPSGFDLSASAARMGRVPDKLACGEGLVVLDRLPVERYTAEENRALGWLLASMLEKGQALAGEPLDAAGTAALAALRELVDDPSHWVEFGVEKGQLQYLNNRRFAHSRTGFADGPGARPRYMLRFWNRDEGTTHLEGA